MGHREEILAHFGDRWDEFYCKYLELPKANGKVKISSPFREDKTASFQISFDGEYAGRWHDFGTAEHGDAFSFYARCKNLDLKRDFPKILQGIAEDFGIPLSPRQTKRKTKTDREALEEFQSQLAGSDLMDHLMEQRGLSENTIAHFELGSHEGRIVFPVRNIGGAIVGFKVHRGAHLKPNGTKARQGQGIPAQLYPIDSLTKDTLVIAEGEPDVWRLHAEGIPAISGTAGSGTWLNEWAEALHGKDVTVIYDNDESGRQGQEKVVKSLIGVARTIHQVQWPEGTDGFDLTDLLQAGNEFEDLPVVEVEIPSTTMEDVSHVVRKWLHLPEGDEELVDVVLAAVIANRFGGDPVWLYVVGPPGGVKTEVLRTLSEWREIYPLTTLTPATLISGYVSRTGDPSLLPKLNGKVLLIKDFTAILESHREARQQILGDLRDAFDGEMAKAFGSDAGTRSYRSHFGVVAAVTPAIDKYAAVNQQLGERFLKFRLGQDESRARIGKALKNSGHEETMRRELSDAVEGALLTCTVNEESSILVTDAVQEKIIDLADVTATLRSQVARSGYDRDIQYAPQAEIGTRLGKQLIKLARGVAAIRGKTEAGEEEYLTIRRVAQDTLPSLTMARLRVLYRVYDDGFLSTKRLAEKFFASPKTTQIFLQDWLLLRLVQKTTQAKEIRWKLKPSLKTVLDNLGFFTAYEMSEATEVSDEEVDNTGSHEVPPDTSYAEAENEVSVRSQTAISVEDESDMHPPDMSYSVPPEEGSEETKRPPTRDQARADDQMDLFS